MTPANSPRLFHSRDIDILTLSGTTDPPSAEGLLALDARLGEHSPFHDHHGFYVEGIHKDVVVLPKHWDNRLIHVTVADGSSELHGRTVSGSGRPVRIENNLRCGSR